MGAFTIKLALTTFLVLLSIAWLRLLYVLPRFRARPNKRQRGSPTHLLVVLGSGGHTAEMMYMLDNAVRPRLNWSDYTHRTWVVSSGDSVSALRAKQFEDKIHTQKGSNCGTYEVVTVPRARKIYQPLWTSPFTCLHCGWECVRLLAWGKNGFPDLVMTNGPATATVLIFTTVLLRYFNLKGCHSQGKMRSIYVESWARVKGMSLSGRLLCWVADRVLVQWEQLKGAGGRAEYHGVLCF
ncbi:glycosyltransferase family 1 protein [Myriangium duriaei CBS 260.36]|uniref:UDP-N-acetylglucosamine transferase subunit ALG14 n=1 Tax=Myriangium duriaei CBS 260.36 TaxID=1168546 RepID=A0A9P4J1T5_9PEZI|nr:glycosyltransferase family 1 protein [Myriangium duriaei CBS 260.36]